MEPSLWVSVGLFFTGAVSILGNIVYQLRTAAKSDGDLTLSRLNAVVEAQGSWISEQAEQIVILRSAAEAMQVRMVATEQHARTCDERLAALSDWAKAQGLPLPP